NGSLSNGAPLAEAHPKYLKELFGQRVSISHASKHTAPVGSLTVTDVYTLPELTLKDQERFVQPESTGGTVVGVGTRRPKITPAPPALRGGKPGQAAGGGGTDYGVFIIVRATISSAAADEKNSLVTFTPAAVRLCTVVKNAEASPPHVSYIPIGTLGEARTLY